jgi:hypothetical protein
VARGQIPRPSCSTAREKQYRHSQSHKQVGISLATDSARPALACVSCGACIVVSAWRAHPIESGWIVCPANPSFPRATGAQQIHLVALSAAPLLRMHSGQLLVQGGWVSASSACGGSCYCWLYIIKA